MTYQAAAGPALLGLGGPAAGLPNYLPYQNGLNLIDPHLNLTTLGQAVKPKNSKS